MTMPTLSTHMRFQNIATEVSGMWYGELNSKREVLQTLRKVKLYDKIVVGIGQLGIILGRQYGQLK